MGSASQQSRTGVRGRYVRPQAEANDRLEAAPSPEKTVASSVLIRQNEPFCLMSRHHPQQRRGFAPRFFPEHWTKR